MTDVLKTAPRVRAAAVLLVAALLMSIAILSTGSTAGAAGEPVATSAGSFKKCNIRGQERKLGASYVTKLKVRGVSCRKGKKVVRAFHACRKQNGGADGYCRRKVKRFRCGENREGISIQYSSTVKCRKGGKRVNHTYTQNT